MHEKTGRCLATSVTTEHSVRVCKVVKGQPFPADRDMCDNVVMACLSWTNPVSASKVGGINTLSVQGWWQVEHTAKGKVVEQTRPPSAARGRSKKACLAQR